MPKNRMPLQAMSPASMYTRPAGRGCCKWAVMRWWGRERPASVLAPAASPSSWAWASSTSWCADPSACSTRSVKLICCGDVPGPAGISSMAQWDMGCTLHCAPVTADYFGTCADSRCALSTNTQQMSASSMHHPCMCEPASVPEKPLAESGSRSIEQTRAQVDGCSKLAAQQYLGAGPFYLYLGTQCSAGVCPGESSGAPQTSCNFGWASSCLSSCSLPFNL